MSKKEGLVLVFFDPARRDQALEVVKNSSGSYARLVLGDELTRILPNLNGERENVESSDGHDVFWRDHGEGIFRLMGRIFDFPPEEMRQFVLSPERESYRDLKGIYQAFRGSLQGDNHGDENPM
jgi:hypothetical protein